jgi:hypothetical protein
LETTGWAPSVAEFLEIRARSRTLDQIALAEHRDIQLSGAGEPVRVFGARVTAIAPGEVDGLLQIDAEVPSGLTAGNVPIVVPAKRA